ncbi:restriction endonuclease subunit S [Shewanella nanhaiensis]|uniref:Restriction endonuclease subunit S n=1 Tax=Shewanella nanhaiensis TaxID=2864872 RepID=A0ABS7EBL5_9GAMM|nr:restriction endonuclease subunit S [Shewanella nanhaiensis]MBW8186571.1 restriction endonuclease subunit S [Shewanella nanhaiensis]
MSNTIPEGWVQNKLGKYVGIQGGNAFKSEAFTEVGIPVVRISNIKKDGSINLNSSIFANEDASLSRFKVQYGDILIAMSGATTGKVGRYTLNNYSYLNQRVGRFFAKGSNDVSMDYIHQVTAKDSFVQSILIDAIGGAQPNISNQQIESIIALFPPLPEQQKIAAILTSVDEVIEKTQAQINKLKDLKTAMMQTLLTNGVGTKQGTGNGECYIPHTEFKDSPVGRIPKSWEVVTLRDVVIDKGLQTGPFGSQLHAHEYVEKGIPVVMPKNMKSNRVSSEGIAQITLEKAESLSKHRVLSGDILFSRRGDIGRFALIEDVNIGSICGTGCLKARLNDSMSSSFFAAYLTLEYVVEWLINNSVGQTMLNLNTSILAALPVLKPPLEEQNKIASLITSLDKNMTLKEKKLLSLKNTKKALMQDLLTGKVRVKLD